MPRRLPVPVLALVTVLVLAGCGGDDAPQRSAEPTGTPGATSTTTTEPTTTPTGPPTGTDLPTTAGSPTAPVDGCTDARITTIPDGTWDGPLRMEVRGVGGTAEFDDTPGRGRLSLEVRDGEVVDGSWQVRWTSAGEAVSGKARAELTVVGSLDGTISGPARKPVLAAAWKLRGSTTVTIEGESGYEAPIDEPGRLRSALVPVRTTGSCTGVRATFTTAFTSKETQAEFRGRATWTGTR